MLGLRGGRDLCLASHLGLGEGCAGLDFRRMDFWINRLSLQGFLAHQKDPTVDLCLGPYGGLRGGGAPERAVARRLPPTPYTYCVSIRLLCFRIGRNSTP